MEFELIKEFHLNINDKNEIFIEEFSTLWKVGKMYKMQLLILALLLCLFLKKKLE